MRFVAFVAVGVMGVAALATCKINHVDRDGFAERDYDGTGPERAKERTGTTTVTGADLGLGTVSGDLAVERLVAARCLREMSCNNVGADKHFATHDMCASQLRATLGRDFQPSACTKGVDEAALDKCMDSIQTESCNNAVDTIERLATCRTSALCKS